jgi:hypothetical protein
MHRTLKEIGTNTGTRWEVGLIRGETVIKVLGYTAQKTKRGLFNQIKEDLTQYFTEEELASDWRYSTARGVEFNQGSIRLAFTGRTERTAATLRG